MNGQTPRPSPEASPSPPPRTAFWTAELPGGTFTVANNTISSVSIHDYQLEGGVARVTEVSIGTTGSVQARFYVIDQGAPTPGVPGASAVEFLEQKAREATERVTPALGDSGQKVTKSYPITTHAHTVVFRLESREILRRLFESAQSSWMMRKSETFKP